MYLKDKIGKIVLLSKISCFKVAYFTKDAFITKVDKLGKFYNLLKGLSILKLNLYNI